MVLFICFNCDTLRSLNALQSTPEIGMVLPSGRRNAPNALHLCVKQVPYIRSVILALYGAIWRPWEIVSQLRKQNKKTTTMTVLFRQDTVLFNLMCSNKQVTMILTLTKITNINKQLHTSVDQKNKIEKVLLQATVFGLGSWFLVWMILRAHCWKTIFYFFIFLKFDQVMDIFRLFWGFCYISCINYGRVYILNQTT